MKKFLFITDFDGTVTAQDFFIQILYRYKPKLAFIKNDKKGVDLLNEVFHNLNLTEEEILDEIKHVAVDPYFYDFVNFVKQNGGDVLILSAGAHYYVENRLKMENLNNCWIIANNSCYKDGSIKLIKNSDLEYYDETYGIDKAKIVKNLKNDFDKLFYAGDSHVDFDACRLCDYKFSKGNLSKILKLFCYNHYNFFNFLDIQIKLKEILKKL